MVKKYTLAPQWEKQKARFQKSGKVSNCPVWPNFQNNKCWEIIDTSRDMYQYWSPRAGGSFSLSGSIADTMAHLLNTDRKRRAFSRWVYEKNMNGNLPEIMSTDIEKITSQKPLSIIEQIRSLLMAHAEITAHPSLGLFHSGSVYEGAYNGKLLAYAKTDCLNSTDYSWLQDAANQNGDLEIINGHIRITPAGLVKLEKNLGDRKSDQAFVAMWFDSSVDSVYDEAIEVAIKSGYTAYRVDRDNTHSDQITNKILAEIKTLIF